MKSGEMRASEEGVPQAAHLTSAPNILSALRPGPVFERSRKKLQGKDAADPVCRRFRRVFREQGGTR